MKNLQHFFAPLFLFILVSFNSNAQQSITPQQAAQHMNDTVTVCGKIFYSTMPNISKDEPLQLCMSADFPNQPLTIVVSQRTKKSFSYNPEKKLVNSTVCVNGVITTYGDKPAIIIADQKQFIDVKE